MNEFICGTGNFTKLGVAQKILKTLGFHQNVQHLQQFWAAENGLGRMWREDKMDEQWWYERF